MLNERNYGQWKKKIDKIHIFRYGDSETLCGKPMLGNNYEMLAKEIDYCPECQRIWEEENKMKLIP